MRLFALLLLLPTIACAQTVIYVNTASTSGGDGTQNVTSGAHRAFPRLFDACTSLPAVMTNQTTIYCDGSGGADVTAVVQQQLNMVTSATKYLLITTQGAARHVGAWDLSSPHYWMSVTNINGAIYCNIGAHVRIDGLQILVNASDGSSSHNGIKTSNANQSATDIDMRCSNCIILGNESNGSQITGLVSRWPSGGNNSNQGTSKFWNNIVMNCHAGWAGDWLYDYVYNCTFYNGTYGMVADNTITAINCLSANPASSSFVSTFGAASDYNAESDSGTIPGAHSRSSQTFSFVNTGAHNLTLTSSDTGATGHGVTDPSGGLFNTDIAGNVRSVPWSIGASQLASPAQFASGTSMSLNSATLQLNGATMQISQ